MATITKLPSGKYRAQVRKQGIYKARTFDRKADAKAWAADIERAVGQGSQAGTISSEALTFGDLMGAYLEQVETGRTTKATLNRIKGGALGKVKLKHLDAVHMAEFVERRRKDGITGATLAGDLSALSAVLKWGRRVKKLDINEKLAAEARGDLTAARIDTRSQERDRIPTDDELAALVAYFDGNPRQGIPMGDITKFGAASAMRLSEITRIRIEDFDREARTVIIRERKDPRRKARNDQTVPLVGTAFDLAIKHAGDRTSGRIFDYEAKSASTAFTRAVAKLGIADLHFHDLRHLAVTSLFRAGLGIELVAVVSGHRDWKHLKRYTQLGAADVHAALARA
ncbi:site-specific integrase [Salipiger sp. H15]|uniref:Site-specific integrase n=1 Tax=Alloyangia sp. H15 TaxID=3029062 RepID=A0AAU8AFB2_9RHOB